MEQEPTLLSTINKTRLLIVLFVFGLFFLSAIGIAAYYLKKESINQQIITTCGDGICQSVTCQAIGCPIPETRQNCPQDCYSPPPPSSYTPTTTQPTTTTNNKEQLCIQSGGNVSKMQCCKSVIDFPNTCTIGSCGCAPENSHEVNTCICPVGACFNGDRCLKVDLNTICEPTNNQCLGVEIDETYYYYDREKNKCFPLQALCGGTRFNSKLECAQFCVDYAYPMNTPVPTTNTISECDPKKGDCPSGSTCKCIRIIPDCPACEGGKCQYKCVQD